MMNEDELAATKERAEAATVGPWETVGALVVAYGEDGANICAVSEPRATTDVRYTPLSLGSKDGAEAYANADFIAHARTDIPRLLAALASVTKERDTYEEAFVELNGHYDKMVTTLARQTERAETAFASLASAQTEIERLKGSVESLRVDEAWKQCRAAEARSATLEAVLKEFVEVLGPAHRTKSLWPKAEAALARAAALLSTTEEPRDD